MRTGRFATTPGTTTPQHVDKDNTEETAALATATQWLEGDGNSPAANISVSAQARRWTADGETARPGASECVYLTLPCLILDMCVAGAREH